MALPPTDDPTMAIVTPHATDASRGLLVAGPFAWPCALGRGGVRLQKREGDGATPAGDWPVRQILYRRDKLASPTTGPAIPASHAIPTIPAIHAAQAIRPDDGWCDDPASPLYNQPVQPGQYWYDPISGLYGNWGREPIGYIRAGHPYGSAPPNASNGNTGIFLNGRQINIAELAQWQTLFKQRIVPGRYWLDGNTGNVGAEGNSTPTGNVRAAMQANRAYR